MRYFYEVGDMVKLQENWLDWKRGEIARIKQVWGNYGMQDAILENDNPHLCHTLNTHLLRPTIEVIKV